MDRYVRRSSRGSRSSRTNSEGSKAGHSRIDSTSTPDVSMSSSQTRFAEVIEGSINTSVDPLCCVPMTNIRRLSRSGINRLKHLFQTTGFISGSDLAIVMPLTGAHRHYIASHFRSIGLSTSEVKEKVDSKDEWYGVIDGMHRYCAITEMMKEDSRRWEGFLWPVTMLRGGFSLQTLKQLARVQNAKHCDSYYIEPTFFDMLSGLREEYDRIKSHRGSKKVTSAEVSAAYDGASHAKESTIKQTAATAVRLDHSVIKAIGEVMNEEHPELAASCINPTLNSSNKEDVQSKVDCRVYRKFINITSLKQATVFMKAEEKEGRSVQVNTIYRLREVCKLNNFKPVQHSIVAEQYIKATKALKEARKFETFLESKTWPTDMAAIQTNMLRGTKLDSEVEENQGNETKILPFLKDIYYKLYPASAPVKMAKFEAQFSSNTVMRCGGPERESSDQVDASATVPDVEPPEAREIPDIQLIEEPFDQNVVHGRNREAPNSTADCSSPQGKKDVPGKGEKRKRQNMENDTSDMQHTETSERLETRQEAVEMSPSPASHSPHYHLKDKNIVPYQMSWQEFDKSVRNADDALYDMLLTDPPYGLDPNASGAGSSFTDNLDDEEMVSFAKFASRTIKHGGYVFIFTSVRYMQKWIGALRNEGFRAMSHVYTIVKSPERVQYHRLSSFPQNICEYGVVARKLGSHPQQFQPDFSSPFHRLRCKYPRRFSSVIEVPVTNNKLKHPGRKTPVRVEEKNTDLLVELLTTFCPENGSVLDAYAGTMTTALACLETGRSCVCIEKDPECFRLAHARLHSRIISIGTAIDEGIGKDTEIRHLKGREYRPSKKQKQGVVTRKSSADGENVLPQTPEDPSINSCAHLCTSGKARLYVDKEIVGYAELALPAPGESGNVRRVLHNHNLAELSQDGECLVVVWRVNIESDKGSLPYPYDVPGVEISPKTLADMSDSFYCWDAKKMAMVDGTT